MDRNDFYVYEHIRKDNDSCFYVGKGCGDRAYSKHRSELHDLVCNQYGMYVKILYDRLTERMAYSLEQAVIVDYVINQGYGIDINGFRDRDPQHFLTNRSFGGDGGLRESRTDDQWEETRQKLSAAFSGEKNPMYGISPRERMDDETYEIWFKKTSDRCSNQCGAKNPNYGNDTLHRKLEEHPELRTLYYSRPGAQNGRAKPIEIYNEQGVVVKFLCIKECAEWIKTQLGIDTKIDGMTARISRNAKDGLPYRGYQLRFIDSDAQQTDAS